MSYMHKDVLSTIVNSEIDRLLSEPDKATIEDVALLMMHSRELAHTEYKDVAKQLIEMYALYKDRQELIRIYQLFLDNHGLSDKFEDFCNRIIRKKYGIK